jgi:hypothetical protein
MAGKIWVTKIKKIMTGDSFNYAGFPVRFIFLSASIDKENNSYF